MANITIIPPKPHTTIQSFRDKRFSDRLIKEREELKEELLELMTEADVPHDHPARKTIHRIFND
jgi:hypothetical protein